MGGRSLNITNIGFLLPSKNFSSDTLLSCISDLPTVPDCQTCSALSRVVHEELSDGKSISDPTGFNQDVVDSPLRSMRFGFLELHGAVVTADSMSVQIPFVCFRLGHAVIPFSKVK